MTDTQNNAADSTAKADKKKTTAEGMDSRRIFASSAAATQYLMACADRFSDFDEDSQTIVIPFVDNEGALDSEKFDADGYETMVATLKERGADRLKAVVVTPVPSLELLLESEEGTAFVREIMHKELNHRAVRQLRVAENPKTVADQIPYSVTSFTTSSRADSGIIESFNDLYKDVNDTMGKASKAWKRRKLNKSELRAALESKAFALENYPELEEAGANGSLFVMALKLASTTATKKGLDTTIFTRWMESRDAATYEPDEAEDEEINFDSLAEAMLAEPEAEPAEAQGGEAKAPEPAAG